MAGVGSPPLRLPCSAAWPDCGGTDMWTYFQSTGNLMKPDGGLMSKGYSGDPSHMNEPEAQKLSNEGPIPVGKYEITEPIDTAFHGPYCLGLVPDPGNAMWGRSGFLIHGDSIENPGTASHGCIIMPRYARERVWESGDHQLIVFSSPS